MKLNINLTKINFKGDFKWEVRSGKYEMARIRSRNIVCIYLKPSFIQLDKKYPEGNFNSDAGFND